MINRAQRGYASGMDMLRRLPVVGRVWRAYEWYDARRGDRLAGAVTYFGFLSIFPLIVLLALLLLASLGGDALNRLEAAVQHAVPGVGGSLDLDKVLDHAGTVGVIGVALLVYSGLGWVDATRSSLRTMWQVDDYPGNPLLLRLVDLVVMVGLLVLLTLSLAAFALTAAVRQLIVTEFGLEHTFFGDYGLGVLAWAVSLGASFVLFLYLLVAVPRIRMEPRVALQGAVIGTVVFELLKSVIGAYIGDVAGKNLYGAFGLTIALLVWFNLVARLLLFCSAWTATAASVVAEREARENAELLAEVSALEPERQAAVATAAGAQQGAGRLGTLVAGLVGAVVALVVARVGRWRRGR